MINTEIWIDLNLRHELTDHEREVEQFRTEVSDRVDRETIASLARIRRRLDVAGEHEHNTYVRGYADALSGLERADCPSLSALPAPSPARPMSGGRARES